MFSINPAYDMLPASEDINDLFKDEYQPGLENMDPQRKRLYALCEENGVGITVMKPVRGRALVRRREIAVRRSDDPRAGLPLLSDPPRGRLRVGRLQGHRGMRRVAWRTKPLMTRRKTMHPSWLARRSTLISATASTAGIASLAPWASTLPR